MTMSPVRFLLPILLAAALPTHAPGQQASTAAKPPPRTLRVWPVGDAPPFMQEVRDGVRHELEPPPGSIPPRRVTVGLADQPGQGDQAAELRLMLGRLGEAVPVPAGAGPVLLRQAGADGQSAPWLRAARPETGGFILLLWRDPEAASWDQPRALVLPDTPAAAPPGSLTIVNVAPQAVALVLGEEKLVLNPGRPLRRQLGPGRTLPIQAGVAAADGRLERLFSQALEQGPEERTWVVFHRADGVAPRQPVKMLIHRERVVPPPTARPRG